MFRRAGRGPVNAARRAQALAFFKAQWPRLLISTAVVAVFFGNQGFRSLVRNYLELRQLKREIALLEREEGRHAQRLKLLKAGDGSIERMARRELGYVKKGEIEYRFPPPAADASNSR